METRARHLAVGAFVLVLVVCAGLFAIWVAKFRGEVTYLPYYTRFSGSVSQLRADTTVLFGGIPVGRITDVRIDPQNTELARVDFVVREDTPIREDSKASAEIQSIAGGSVLQLSRGSAEAKLLPPGHEVPSVSSAIEQLVNRAPDLLNKFDKIADNLNAMLSTENSKAVTAMLGNLRDLSVDLKSHTQQLDSLLDNGNNAMQSFSDTGAELRDLTKQLNKNQAVITADARRAMQSFNDMSLSLKATADRFSVLATDNREAIKQFTGSTLYEATDLIAQLRELASSLARISQEIERDPARFFLSDRNKGVTPK